MIIAVEGIDGCGKGTQTLAIRDWAAQRFRDVSTLSFPRYGASKGAALVEHYLNGRLHVGLDDCYGPAMFYALDRFEAQGFLLEFKGSSHACLIVDRYVASNLAHQSAKISHKPTRLSVQRELFEIEHTVLETPQPDLTIAFKIDVDLAHQRIGLKEARDYTTDSHDLHEADPGHLRAASDAYDEVWGQELYQNVKIFSIGPGESIDRISERVTEVLDYTPIQAVQESLAHSQQ